MKYHIILGAILLVPAIAGAQTTFEEEIVRLIAQDSNGVFYYSHFDGYRHAIQSRARKALGIDPSKSSENIAISAALQDVSNNKSEQNETTIAINHRNPNLIIAASNDAAAGSLHMPVYITTDGGLFWHTSRLPALPDDRYAGSDPMIAASDDGRFYYAYITFPKYSAFPYQVVVAISTNGVDWTDMQPVDTTGQNGQTFQDKPTIVVDNSPASPYYGRVYVVWTVSNDIKPNAGLRLTYSDDRGKSWKPSMVLTTEINNLFSQLATGRDGEILISYSSYDDSMHYVLVSTNGGQSFDRRVLHAHIPFPINSRNEYGLKGENGVRAYPYSAIRVDLQTNRLHAVYGTWNTTAIESSAELLYLYSDDLGHTWSEPVPLFGTPGDITVQNRDRFFPWMAYDQVTHELSLVYYSSEEDANNMMTSVYRARIGPQGVTNITPIAETPFDPRGVGSAPPFLGDYIGCDAHRNRFVAAWTQNRPGSTDGDVFAVVLVTDSETSIVQKRMVLINTQCPTILAPVPSMATDHVCINIVLPESTDCRLSLVSMEGIPLKQLFEKYMSSGSYTETVPLNGLESGHYFLRLETTHGNAQQPLTIVR